MKSKIQTTEKTMRALTIFCNIREGNLVSIPRLQAQMPELSRRTFLRDIALLKSAGAQICFKADEKTFKMEVELLPIDCHKATAEQKRINRLRRLMELADEIINYCEWPEDMGEIYASAFPDVSKRTKARDFAMLKEVCHTYVT